MKIISKKIIFLQILLFALLTFSLSFGMNQKQIEPGPGGPSLTINLEELTKILSLKYQKMEQMNDGIKFSILFYLKYRDSLSMKKISEKITPLQILLSSLIGPGPASSSTVDLKEWRLRKKLSFNYQQNADFNITFSIFDYLISEGKNNKFAPSASENNLLSSFFINGKSTATNPELKKLINLPKFFFELLQVCEKRITSEMEKNGCECTQKYLQEINNFSLKVTERLMTLHLMRFSKDTPFLYPDTANFNNWTKKKDDNPSYEQKDSVKISLIPFSWFPNFVEDDNNDKYKKLFSVGKEYGCTLDKAFTNGRCGQESYMTHELFQHAIDDNHRLPKHPLEAIVFQFFEENSDLKKDFSKIHNYKIYSLHSTDSNSIEEIKMKNNPSAFCSTLIKLLMNKKFKQGSTPVLLRNTYFLDGSLPPGYSQFSFKNDGNCHKK